MFREGSFNWFKKNKIDEVEKTKKISSSGDGLNVDAHHLAGDKAELYTYKHTDKPVLSEKGDIISTYKGTGNPEDEMIDEEEANNVDQYAKYNNDPKEIKAGNNSYEGNNENNNENEWEYYGVDEPDFIIDSDKKQIEHLEMVDNIEDDSDEKKLQSSKEVKISKKIETKDVRSANYGRYKASRRNFGKDPRYKDIRTDDREIFGK